MSHLNDLFAADIAWYRHRYVTDAARAAVDADCPADVIAQVAHLAEQRWAESHPLMAVRAPWTHPDLPCEVCGVHRASQVVEVWDGPGDGDRTYQLVCERMLCLSLASLQGETNGVHVDSYPLRSQAEAERISGLDLSAAS